MNDSLPTILIIGCGSIGERHLRTFLATGRCHAIACDTRPAILSAMAEKYRVATTDDWRRALADPAVTAVLVATPAPHHVSMATEVLKSGRHCLIEKPLALKLDGLDELLSAHAASGRACKVAYVHHGRPEVRAARKFLQSGALGRVLSATLVSGQDFPFFRPAYREIYYAHHEQGGGAIQDGLTHMVNLIEWILGPTTSLMCDASHQMLEGVEVEDTVSIVSRNQAGALVTFSLNQFQAPNEGTLQFNAEKGSVKVEYHLNRWGHWARGANDWTWEISPPADRDTFFVTQAGDFLDACEGKDTPMATLPEAIQAVKFNLAAFESWRTGKRVEIA